MNHETDTDLQTWLANLNLAHLTESFIAAGWQGEKLLELTREELADLGVPRDCRGAVMLAIEALPTLPDRQAPNYAPALSEAAVDRCRALGRQPPVPWVDAVADTWPGPIAHEYQRLRQLLEQGQIVAAIFQLKDLAEVLVKFPALVMARDLIEYGDAEAARAARRGAVCSAACCPLATGLTLSLANNSSRRCRACTRPKPGDCCCPNLGRSLRQ